MNGSRFTHEAGYGRPLGMSLQLGCLQDGFPRLRRDMVKRNVYRQLQATFMEVGGYGKASVAGTLLCHI